jgi:pimeloyl-ACP methyl ester carboxylesterase
MFRFLAGSGTLAALGWALALTAFAAAVDVREMPGGKMAILRPEGTARGSVILIPGSTAQQTMSESGQPGSADNFVIRIRRKFVDAGYAIAYLEDPTDLSAPIAAMRAIARPVVVVATSTGTIVTVDNAVRLDKGGPDAIVLTSTVTKPNANFSHGVSESQLRALRIPVLFIHNTNDICRFSPIGSAHDVASADRNADFIEVTSDPVSPAVDQCGPRAPHGYVGIESEVTQRIVDWIAAHASARADS